jgi:5'-phosphate synthase pdxT subunit
MTTIGVLALQGAFSKHIDMVHSLNVKAIPVRKPEDLSRCHGLIIPGGESTTIKRQIDFIQMSHPLKQFAQLRPLFGTCAGLILMSQEIIADPMQPLGIINVSVERNAFGRQYESFIANLKANLSSSQAEDVAAAFIRAPRIHQYGKEVEVLSTYQGEAVLVKQGMHLGATFHPELTQSTAIHKYFISLIKSH